MRKSLLVLTVLAAVLLVTGAGFAGAKSKGKCLLVTDGTDIFFPDDGAIYLLGESGLETFYSGPPLQSPGGIAIEPKTGDVYITDFGAVTAFFGGPDGAIYKFDKDRNIETVYSGAPLGDPYGCMFDSKGDLIVSDFDPFDPNSSNGIVFRVHIDPDHDGKPGPFPLPDSALEIIWAGSPLVGPNHLLEVADEDSDEGTDFITPDDSGNIFRVASDGSDVDTLATDMLGPVGLERDSELGYYYVTSNQTSEISIVYPDGTVAPFIALPLSTEPLSVAEGEKGNFYVANAVGLFVFSSPPAEDGQVMRFTRDGVYEVLFEGAPLVNPFDAHPFKCSDEGAD
jgi:DNA-binding beta-propeller fold protein YncE